MSKSGNNKQYLIYGIVGVLIVAAAFFFFKGTKPAVNSPAPANIQKSAVVDQGTKFQDAPQFTLPDLEGKDVSLSDFKGKLVFLNFWATWCPPCRREIPHFVELVNKYGKDGFTVLGVALDPRDFAKVKPFAKEYGINYPVVYDKKRVSELYGGIGSIPTTFVINRQGKIVLKIVGSRPKEVFENIIKKWL